MRELPKAGVALAASCVLLAFGCQASVSGESQGTGGNHGGGGALNLAGGVSLPEGTQAAALLPARIRRLTNAEYQATVSDRFGKSADGLSADFVPDSRQSGFTVNEAQRVDPVYAGQIAAAASSLGEYVAGHSADFAPCADPSGGGAVCADQFIRSFGEKLYRRPLGEDEVQHLLAVFNVALDGGSYAEGVELTVRAMLQSAAFLYHTEIGAAPAATIRLTPYELASSISYLIKGHPPSDDLVAQAVAGTLDDPKQRGEVVGALFDIQARDRVVRVIREWLGTDRIAETAKDSTVYPAFAGVRGAMERETTEFLQVLVQDEGASLATLLSADFSVVDGSLAPVYGASVSGDFQRVALPGRLGILNQGAFLSVFAHADGTAPVLRGVAIARRVACLELGNPVDLKISVVPPAPDPSKTTRERFDVHATDPTCASCHRLIDNFGFAFEQFDGMGASRTEDNGKPVDTKVSVTGTDFDGAYADSNALVTAMSRSSQVRECFARHVFRALSGSSVAAVKASEDQFVQHWSSTLPMSGGQVLDANILDTLVAFVSDPAFAYRRAQ